MTDNGYYITVEASEQDLQELLTTVRQGKRPVRITVGGQPVADLSPIVLERFGPPDPRLRAKILTDDHEITTEADWPEDNR